MNYIYARSFSGNKERIERQKKICKDYLKDVGCKVDSVFIETSPDRRILKQLHRTIKPGDSIVVSNLGIISRDSGVLIKILEHFPRKARIIISDENSVFFNLD